MYYNIKIKSNGSEFILESNSKDVTQREMDIYFARIFGASEDFEAQIKKIETPTKNVKSIEEIEKMLQYQKEINALSAPVQTFEQFIYEEPKKEETAETNFKEEPKEEIKITTNTIESIPEFNFEQPSQPPQQQEESLKDLITLAQNQLDSIGFNDEQKTEPPKQEVFKNDYDEALGIIPQQVSQIQQEYIHEEIPEKPQITAKDFTTFLKEQNAVGIVDEFLICAYYIKNALGEDSFTMKSINSKLFQATGKIANMAIAQQLMANNYIVLNTTEDTNQYCITPEGESYFLKKFTS